MDDLVRWLGEQLDEDERIARAADPGPWESNSLGRHDQAAIKLGAPTSTSLIQFDGSRAAANGAHVARHDPARVLREIDAKRKLIARGGPFCTSGCDEPGHEPKNPDTNWTTPLEHHFDCAAYEAARVLALPYADRPGYREEWRP